MPTLKLTEKRIKELPVPTDQDKIEYWDTEVRRLCVRVFKSGRRRFVFPYRFESRKQKWHRGPFCTDYSLEGFRNDVREWKVMLTKGINPFESINDKIAADKSLAIPTLGEACQFNLNNKISLKVAKGEGFSPRTLTTYKDLHRIIEGDESGIWNEVVTNITLQLANSFMEKKRLSPRTHDALRTRLMNVWKNDVIGAKAIGRWDILYNPWELQPKLYKLPKAVDLPRHSDEEIYKIKDYLRRAEQRTLPRVVNPVWVDFMWFIIENGTRPTETLEIEIPMINLQKGYILHGFTKTGVKEIFLADETIERIKARLAVSSSKYLFPGRKGNLTNYKKEYGCMRKHIGEDLTQPYGIRRWYAKKARLALNNQTKKLQKVMGWETEEIARRYSEDEEVLEKEIIQNRKLKTIVDEYMRKIRQEEHSTVIQP